MVAIILPNGGGGGLQMHYRYDAYGQPIAINKGNIYGYIEWNIDVDSADFLNSRHDGFR